MQIYIARGGQHHGPYDLEAVKAGLGTGAFSPADLAWYEGAPNWSPLSTLPGLQETASSTPAPVPTPVTPPPATVPTTSFAPTTPSVAPVYDPNAPWARGAGRAGGLAGLFKLLPVRIGVGVLGLIAMVSGISTIIHGSKSSSSSSSGETQNTANATPAGPAAGNKRYVNDPRNFGQNWQVPILDFYFDYPEQAPGWTLPPQQGTPNTRCYVYMTHDGQVQGQNIKVELLSVSYTPLSQGDDGHQVAAQIKAGMVANSGNGFRSQGEKKTRLGSLDAYELYGVQSSRVGYRMETIYWRWVIVIPPDPGKGGVVLEMVCDSQATGVRSAEEVGTQGVMAVVLNSFHFGK